MLCLMYVYCIHVLYTWNKQCYFVSFACVCVHRCWDALELNKKLITEEQKDYQKELSAKFKLFCDKLEPMVSTKKKHKRSR